MKKSEKFLLFILVIIFLFLIGFGSYCIIIKPFYKNSVQVIDKVENSDIIITRINKNEIIESNYNEYKSQLIERNNNIINDFISFVEKNNLIKTTSLF